MIRKSAFLLIIIFFSINIYAQQDKINSAQEKKADTIPNIPAQSQYSDRVEIKNVNFIKRVDHAGEGEILEIQFVLESNIDEPQDLFLFVIATYEKTEKTRSSFEMPVPEKERIRSFVPFPDDIKNFEYVDPDKGNAVKLFKFPKNPKAGVDPATGKPYHLKDKLNIWTTHLSKYRNNYFFFNEVTILIFDKDGNPLFRQLYAISGKRT